MDSITSRSIIFLFIILCCSISVQAVSEIDEKIQAIDIPSKPPRELSPKAKEIWDIFFSKNPGTAIRDLTNEALSSSGVESISESLEELSKHPFISEARSLGKSYKEKYLQDLFKKLQGGREKSILGVELSPYSKSVDSFRNLMLKSKLASVKPFTEQEAHREASEVVRQKYGLRPSDSISNLHQRELNQLEYRFLLQDQYGTTQKIPLSKLNHWKKTELARLQEAYRINKERFFLSTFSLPMEYIPAFIDELDSNERFSYTERAKRLSKEVLKELRFTGRHSTYSAKGTINRTHNNFPIFENKEGKLFVLGKSHKADESLNLLSDGLIGYEHNKYIHTSNSNNISVKNFKAISNSDNHPMILFHYLMINLDDEYQKQLKVIKNINPNEKPEVILRNLNQVQKSFEKKMILLGKEMSENSLLGSKMLFNKKLNYTNNKKYLNLIDELKWWRVVKSDNHQIWRDTEKVPGKSKYFFNKKSDKAKKKYKPKDFLKKRAHKKYDGGRPFTIAKEPANSPRTSTLANYIKEKLGLRLPSLYEFSGDEGNGNFIYRDFDEIEDSVLVKKNTETSLQVVQTSKPTQPLDDVLIIPTRNNMRVINAEVQVNNGKLLERGVDFDIFQSKGRSGSFIKFYDQPEGTNYNFRAHFAKLHTPTELSTQLPSIDLYHMQSVIDDIESIGAKHLAERLKEFVQTSKKLGKQPSPDEILKLFYTNSVYANRFSKNLDNIITEKNRFSKYAKFIRKDGTFCAQCDGSNELFKDFMNALFEKYPNVEFRKRVVFIPKKNQLILDAFHQETELYYKNKLIAVYDATPRKRDGRKRIIFRDKKVLKEKSKGSKQTSYNELERAYQRDLEEKNIKKYINRLQKHRNKVLSSLQQYGLKTFDRGNPTQKALVASSLLTDILKGDLHERKFKNFKQTFPAFKGNTIQEVLDFLPEALTKDLKVLHSIAKQIHLSENGAKIPKSYQKALYLGDSDVISDLEGIVETVKQMARKVTEEDIIRLVDNKSQRISPGSFINCLVHKL